MPETASAPTGRQVLGTPMPANDADAATIGGYLAALWAEGAGFSGKRPFGNSGWEWDLYVPLAKAQLIRGTFDEDGYLEDVDDAAGDALIKSAIQVLAEDAERSAEAGESADA